MTAEGHGFVINLTPGSDRAFFVFRFSDFFKSSQDILQHSLNGCLHFDIAISLNPEAETFQNECPVLVRCLAHAVP